MDIRRLVIFLGLNAIVSATVTLSVLWLWDLTHRGPTGVDLIAATAPAEGDGATTPGVPSAAGGGQTGDGETAPQGDGSGSTTSLATITPIAYVVQSGDTLGKIAAEFDVSVEALIAANGLTDPDVLDVGQTLIIPVGEVAAAEPTATELPTATETAEAPSPSETPSSANTPLPTATRAPSGAGPQLAIRGVIGAGDVTHERVTIVNVGSDVSLAGWTLRDEQGNVFFFPALSLFQGGAVNVHTRTGTNTVTDLFWNQTTPVWQTGETVELVDPTGTVHTTFVVP